MRRVFSVESGWGRLRRFYFAIPARRARPASIRCNARKTIVQSVVMGLIFLVCGSFCACALENWLLFHGCPIPLFNCSIGLPLTLLGGGFVVSHWSAWVLVCHGEGTPLPLDATNRLVVRGPYRWIRNPMACASLIQGVAVGLALGSPLVLMYVLCGALAWNYTARPWEEADMEARFGDEFRSYKSAVRCWLPRLRPYSPGNESPERAS